MEERTPFQNYVDSLPRGGQKWLSKKCKVSHHTINRLYKGYHKPHYATCMLLKKVTKLSVAELSVVLNTPEAIEYRARKSKREKAYAERTESAEVVELQEQPTEP